MTDNTLSAKHSIAVYVGLWLFLLAIAFYDKPMFFYPLIGGAALAVFSVLGSFVFQQYRCYLYAKKAIMYGANMINYCIAAKMLEKILEKADTDNVLLFYKAYLPRVHRDYIEAERDKLQYYKSCEKHCLKRQKFYMNLMIYEGMDREIVLSDIMSAAGILADHNPEVIKLRRTPSDWFNIDEFVKSIRKVEG